MPVNLRHWLDGRGRLSGARGNLAIFVGLLVIGLVLFVNQYMAVVPASYALTEQVQQVIAGTLSPEQCLAPANAIPKFRSALDSAGYQGWAVRRDAM